MNIKRRGVKDVDTRCPVCKCLDEDEGHCFLKCKAVQKCWQALNIERVRVRLLEMASPRDVVQHILNLKGKDKAMVPCFLWTWWDARNKANAEEGMPTTEEVQHKTMEAAFNTVVPKSISSRQSVGRSKSSANGSLPHLMS
jgi:hypothetical protein